MTLPEQKEITGIVEYCKDNNIIVDSQRDIVRQTPFWLRDVVFVEELKRPEVTDSKDIKKVEDKSRKIKKDEDYLKRQEGERHEVAEGLEICMDVLTSLDDKPWGDNIQFKRGSLLEDGKGVDLVGGITLENGDRVIIGVDVTTARDQEKVNEKIEKCIENLLLYGGTKIKYPPKEFQDGGFPHNKKSGSGYQEIIPFVAGFTPEHVMDINERILGHLGEIRNMETNIKQSSERLHILEQIGQQVDMYIAILRETIKRIDNNEMPDIENEKIKREFEKLLSEDEEMGRRKKLKIRDYKRQIGLLETIEDGVRGAYEKAREDGCRVTPRLSGDSISICIKDRCDEAQARTEEDNL